MWSTITGLFTSGTKLVTGNLSTILLYGFVGVLIVGGATWFVHDLKEKGALEERAKNLEATIKENDRLITIGQLSKEEDNIQAKSDSAQLEEMRKRLASSDAYFDQQITAKQQQLDQKQQQLDQAKTEITAAKTMTLSQSPATPTTDKAIKCFEGEDFQQLRNIWK